jgi:poly-beta-1,6-N-acetyl-D-glucosamine synthase
MPDVLILIVFLLVTAYLALIIIFIRGWTKIPFADTDSLTAEANLKPSVVICCKNEAHHLPALIDALKNQSYQQFELIWVNDHSTDETQLILEASANCFSDVKILHAPAPGKKKAQKAGILAATGNFIITTDADCIPRTKWIETLVTFQLKHQLDMIIAPVKLHKGTNLFTKLQQLEFATLVGSGMAAAGYGTPIFCNAANMAFKKEVWLNSLADLHEEEPSGDDVFLLHSIKRRNGKVAVLKSMQAMMLTGYQKTLRDFVRQRVRWTSKSSKYRDGHIITTGLIVAAVNLLLLGLLFVAIVMPQYWLMWFLVFLLKYCVDYLFLLHIKPFFQMKFSFVTVFLLSILYPFYIAGIGILSLLQKNTRW